MRMAGVKRRFAARALRLHLLLIADAAGVSFAFFRVEEHLAPIINFVIFVIELPLVTKHLATFYMADSLDETVQILATVMGAGGKLQMLLLFLLLLLAQFFFFNSLTFQLGLMMTTTRMITMAVCVEMLGVGASSWRVLR